MMTATPCRSYWGRPALPIIWSTSVMGKSTYRLRTHPDTHHQQPVLGRSVDAPSQGGGGNQDLNLAGNKEALACSPVPISQASVMHANAKLQSVAQTHTWRRDDTKTRTGLRGDDTLDEGQPAAKTAFLYSLHKAAHRAIQFCHSDQKQQEEQVYRLLDAEPVSKISSIGKGRGQT
ncbi:MAG: hypothetical protein FRX49_06060 [Trebouxia sp. A1-2]|nr:MAG: hypothetical protein FRX49_06060 [Trebouxia sp. A1-2]